MKNVLPIVILLFTCHGLTAQILNQPSIGPYYEDYTDIATSGVATHTSATATSTMVTPTILAKVSLEGAVRNISSGKENSGVTTGGIGISLYKKSEWKIHAQININSTIDTLKQNHGSGLLNPLSGESLQSGLMDFHLMKKDKFYTGFHGYLFASSSLWSTLHDENRVTAKATVVGGGLLLYWDMIPDSYVQKNNPVKLKLETGLSVRSISGNILLNNTLSDAFDIEQKVFMGLEGGAVIGFNNINAGLSLYWFFKGKNRPHVPHLTGVQVIGGIAISSDLFSKKISAATLKAQ